MSHSLSPEEPGFPEKNGDLSFEFLYGIVTGRLQEALAFQATNPRYRHVWIERFPDIDGDFASFTLAHDYEELLQQSSEQFDVAIPVTGVTLDETKILSDVKVAEGQDAKLVFSTARYDPAHRYLITSQSVGDLETFSEPELNDIVGKLLTYDIVPFRIHKDIA